MVPSCLGRNVNSRAVVAAVLGGLLVLLPACYKGPAASSPSAAPSATGPSYAVRAGQTSVNGGTRNVLFDASGNTLYFRSKDTAASVCSGSCANIWVPLLAPPGTPTLDPALTGNLTVVANANGNQLAYNGHPLYRYSGDAGGAQATGEGISGIWFVAEP